MSEYLHIGWDVFSNSVLITGLVLIMMLMIEYFNVYSQGRWLSALHGSKIKQILVSACLGLIPGCIGGFAVVSFYTHKLISLGALVAMMIASSGDEAFIILAMIPDKSLLIFGLLFVIAVVAGILTDYLFFKKNNDATHSCSEEISYHSNDINCETPSIFKASSYAPMKKPSPKRVIIMIAIALFISAVIGGIFTCSHSHDGESCCHDHEHIVCEDYRESDNCTLHVENNNCEHQHEKFHFNLLDEQWLNIIFAVISIITLFFTATAKEHFINDHIWNHLIKHHALSIFLWTFGTLLICQIGLQYLDVSKFITDNMLLILILSVIIGIIPESGPHIVFITLYAQGIIPLYILIVNSIVQDGHTTLPLLAHNKLDFLKAKMINIVIGLIIGCCCYLLM